jgi:hypothetical protein
MDANPEVYSEIVNQANQTITFMEHPYKGEDYPVIAVCHEFKVAYCTDFWDIFDFRSGSDYNPIVREDGSMVCFFEI